MSRKNKVENLVKVKTMLAEKAESLVRVRKSKPAKAKLERLAARFRRQADDFRRMA